MWGLSFSTVSWYLKKPNASVLFTFMSQKVKFSNKIVTYAAILRQWFAVSLPPSLNTLLYHNCDLRSNLIRLCRRHCNEVSVPYDLHDTVTTSVQFITRGNFYCSMTINVKPINFKGYIRFFLFAIIFLWGDVRKISNFGGSATHPNCPVICGCHM